MKQVDIGLLDNGFPQSYLREVSLLKSLRHENIVHFIDIIWDESDHKYLIIEHCIFSEMASGAALFLGDSEIDQVKKIFSIMGAPNEDSWPGVSKLRFFTESSQNNLEMCLHKNVLLRGSGFDLLRKMHIYNPDERISAKRILKHSYFNGYNPYKRLPPVEIKPKPQMPLQNKVNDKSKES